MFTQFIPEIWHPVVGYEGRYEVSQLGRVRSLLHGEPRLMKHSFNRKGYPIVGITRHRKTKSMPVHRLVAEAFIGPRPQGYVINHIDGVKTNNFVENLEYVTPAENSLHATRILKVGPVGENHPDAKLTVEEVRAIRLLYKSGKYTQQKLADMFGLSNQTVNKLIRYLIWKTVNPDEEQ